MNELKKIKKETGFKVPDNYFDDFSSKMIDIVNEEEKKSYSIIRILKPIIYLAAMIAGFAVITYYAYNLVINNNSNENQIVAQSNYEEDYFSEELIIDVLSDRTEEDTLKEEFLVDYLGDEVPYEDLLAEL